MTRSTTTPRSTALLTDRYELTMLSAALADGTAQLPAVFELFTRRLPAGRGYGVVAGVGRFLDELENFTFTAEQLAWLTQIGAIDQRTAEYLTDWKFRGTIVGYREGDLYFANSPVLTVRGTFGDAVLLETLALSVYNHDCAIASAAARIVDAAAGRPVLEMGSRRTHEQAALAAARAAYIAGFAATSNLAAGMRYAIPTIGTSAHAFTLAHRSEVDAFTAQVNTLSKATTLLVDTYDTAEGIQHALAVAGPELGGIRLDSGDLGAEAHAARSALDAAGATATKVVATSDLDEFAIAELADAPIDVYGAGTRLVTGSGHPTAGMVYKLVAIAESTAPGAPMRPVAKAAAGKVSVGGEKVATRILDHAGHIVAEDIRRRDDEPAPVPPGHSARTLQTLLWFDGNRVDELSLEAIRADHAAAFATLTAADRELHVASPRIAATRTPAADRAA